MKSKAQPTRTRAPHEKSKNGCVNCKQRKIKCDETHPFCYNCEKKGLRCEFPILVLPDAPAVGIIDCGDMSRVYSADVPRLKKRLTEWAEKNGATPHSKISNSPSADVNSDLVRTNNGWKPVSSDDFQVNEMSLTIGHVQLPSLNMEKAFPSYTSNTIMNAKALMYYESIFYYRISPFKEAYLPWSAVTNFVNAYPETYHVTLSLMFLSMYYDNFLEEPLSSDAVEFKNLNDYLVISHLNYTVYYSQLIQSRNRFERIASELFAELVQLKMELLTMLYSPSLTISDSFFVKRAIYADLLNREMLQLMGSSLDTMKVYHLPLNYYLTSAYPTVKEDCKIFFPKYLFQLCGDLQFTECNSASSVSPSSSDATQTLTSTPSSIEEIFKVSVDADDINSTKQFFEREIYLALKSLEREYIQYNNEHLPEMDGMRMFVRWPGTLSQGFATLLAHQDNRALIVMAHFLMLLASQNFKGLFPKKAIIDELSNIDSVLMSRYKGWLLLPKRVVGLI